MVEELKVGILGGGQLGAMLIRHAIDLGLDIAVMDKSAEAPCARYTSKFTCGELSSYEAVVEFGKGLDVLTIEIEAVNIDALRYLAGTGVRVFPSPDTIEIIQDKFSQKTFLQSHDIPVAAGFSVENRQDLAKHSDRLPLCLKKRRDGYDGYGVMMVRTPEDIERAFDAPCVAEELVDIKNELAVIVARNEQGEIKCYDPVVMVFSEDKFLLDFQEAPAEADEAILKEAADLAKRIADKISLVGILAVEMFLTRDNKLVVNELAPRPHNSGHHTIETSVTSQYEQLLRAILGMPLGDTKLTMPSLMMNIIENQQGSMKNIETFKELLALSGVHLHWYGKKHRRPGRKIGHVTITGGEKEDILSKAEVVREILNR